MDEANANNTDPVEIVDITPGSAVEDDSPEAGIEALRQQMAVAEESRKQEREQARRDIEGERSAREEAERRAHFASSEAQSRAVSAFEAQYDSIINAHAAAQGELVAAKSALKSAMAEGDFEKVADMSAEIGTIAARVERFARGKTELEHQRQQGVVTAQPPYVSEDDQRERFIRSKTPKTASWLRRNDRYFTDRNFNLAVTGAHNLAIARGMAADSDEYFRFVEEQSGLRPAGGQDIQFTPQLPPGSTAPVGHATAATAATSTQQRQSPMPSAPAAGSTVSATRPSADNKTITLSSEEREICRVNGITEAAYAKQKKQLLDEGLIGGGGRR